MGNVISHRFKAVNGVKQGGVLLLILFSIYMNELLIRLKKSGIGNVFVAALAYADDVTLICPTLKSLKMIIKICEDYGSEYNVAFNGNKSKLMFFKGREFVKPVSVSVSVNGNTVECGTEADHLGHRVSSQNSDSLVKSAINSFWRGFNLFAAEFAHSWFFKM